MEGPQRMFTGINNASQVRFKILSPELADLENRMETASRWIIDDIIIDRYKLSCDEEGNFVDVDQFLTFNKNQIKAMIRRDYPDYGKPGNLTAKQLSNITDKALANFQIAAKDTIAKGHVIEVPQHD